MADRIEGIVIPIGYDPSEVTKGLKEINKETTESVKELSKIEKALKFNPDNTELLAQKMTVLGDVVGDSKKKLELLKIAAEEAGKNTDTEKGQEEYRKLTREIIETESKMKMYGDRIDTTSDKMSGSLKTLDSMSDGLKKVGDGFKAAGDKMEKAGTGLTKSVTGPIVGIGAAAMVAWNEVDEATDGIIAGTGATGEAAEDLIKSFETVASKVPSSLGEVGTSIANLNTKFGLNGKELEDATEAALQYAQVNKVDVGESVNKVAKVMAAADIDSKDFAKTLSKLTAASQDSGVSVDELTAAYEKSGPVLRTLGYSFDESIAMVGQWEKAGLNAEDMLKGMQKYITGNSKETQKLTDAHAKEEEKLKTLNDQLDIVKNTKGKTGKETEALKKKEEELTKKIAEQEDVVKKSGKALESTTAASREEMDKLVETIKNTKDPQEQLNKAIEVFGTKNGPAFVDAIKSGKLNYEEFAKTIEGSGGRLGDTFEAMLDPVDKLKVTVNKLKITGADFGEQMQVAAIPLIEEFSGKVEDLATWFASLTDEQQQNIIKTGAIIAAVGPVLIIMGKLTTAVGTLSTGASTAITTVSKMFATGGVFGTGGALAGMAGPIGLTVIAVGLLAKAAYDSQAPQREYTQHIKNTTQAVSDFSEMVATAKPNISDFNDQTTRFDQGIADKLAKIKELEPGITQILSDNVKARTNLTTQEMDKLKEYMGLLDTLNDEIAKKYEVRLRVMDEQLKKEGTLNSDAAAKYIADVNKANTELAKNAEENHTEKLVKLDAMLENEAAFRKAGKTKEADAERKSYDELVGIADAAYEKELAGLNLSASNRLIAIKDKFFTSNSEEINNLNKISGFREEERQINADYGTKLDEINSKQNLSQAMRDAAMNKIAVERANKLDDVKKRENGIWTKNTEEVGGALMEQVANIILHGGQIDEKTKGVVDTYMRELAKTPAGAEEFKKSMKLAVDNIVAAEPGLTGEAGNLVKKFNGQIDEIANGKAELGKNTVDTLSSGVLSAKARAENAAISVRNATQNSLDPNYKEVYMSGKNFDGGIADGIREGEYLATNAARWLAGRTVTAFNKRLEINSPSRVMAKSGGWISAGVAGGIEDNAGMVEKAMTDLAKIPQEVDWLGDPIVAGDFERASRTQQMINNYPVININNPQLDSMERVRKLAEELYKLQNQRR